MDIEKQNKLEVSKESADRMMELIDNPQKINENLVDAAKTYRDLKNKKNFKES